MLSIGALSSASQGASYYERDGYYAKEDPEHREASGWAGRGAEELGLKGPVEPDIFRAVLEGKVPDGSGIELGRRGKDGEIIHRPGRDLTFSAPKSVSLAALVGGDRRIVEAHDKAVAATLAWVERNAGETRMKDPDTGRMARAGNGLVGQVDVALGGFDQGVAEQLRNRHHVHAVHGGGRRPAMAKVVQPQAGQSGLGADAVPLGRDVVDGPRRRAGGKEIRAIGAVSGDRVDDGACGAGQPDRARPGLRVG